MRQAKKDWIEHQCREWGNWYEKKWNKKGVWDSQEKQRWISSIKEKDARSLNKHKDIIKCLMENCMELYTHDAGCDPVIITNSHPAMDENLTILQEEVETVVKSLRKGKSTVANIITAEMIKCEGEHIIDVLTTICFGQNGGHNCQWTPSPKRGIFN